MILRDVPTDIRVGITGSDGKLVTNSPAVKLTAVRDSDSVTVINNQSASEDGSGTGIYKYTVPSQDELDLLRLSWVVGSSGSGGTFTTLEEIVGGYMCTLEEISEDLTGTYTAAQLALARTIAETWLEQECGCSFRPRYARETHDGGGESILLRNPKPIRLRSLSISGQDVDVLTLPLSGGGLLSRTSAPTGVAALWTAGVQNISIAYEHGYEQTPAPGRRAAARLARFFLAKRPSNFDERATSYATEEATYTLVTPGLRGAIFSLPEVNAFVQSYSFVEVG